MKSPLLFKSIFIILFGLLISIEGKTQICDTPSNLSCAEVLDTQLGFKWNSASGALSYVLRYRAGSGGSWNQVAVNDTITSQSGLTANTEYQWQVYSVCVGDSSDWSVIQSCRTRPNCRFAERVRCSNETDTSYTLTWDTVRGASSFLARYAIVFDEIDTIPTTNNTIVITGLSPNTSYRNYIKTVCVAGDTSLWSSLTTCRTANVVSIQNIHSISELNVSPNPSSGFFTVQFKMDTPKDLELRVTNLLGQQVFEQNIQGTTGELNYEIDLSDQPIGFYLIELRSETGREIRKVELK